MDTRRRNHEQPRLLHKKEAAWEAGQEEPCVVSSGEFDVEQAGTSECTVFHYMATTQLYDADFSTYRDAHKAREHTTHQLH